MRFLTPFIYLIAVTTVAAVGLITWIGFSFKQFETVEAFGSLECTPVVGIVGAADIETIPDSSAAYMASFDRRGGATRGAVLRFDTENPLDNASWRDRTDGKPVMFEPMGIDLYHARLPDGRWLSRLFVVNLAGPEVLLYDVDANGDLALRERFSDPRIVSPNDVVATGPRSFYVTNDTASGQKSFRGKLDFLLGFRTGQVFHYDGNSWSDVVDNLAFPNGLALTADGRTLYLAEMRAKSLARFERDPDSDVLTPVDSVPLETFPDNLSIDAQGHVLVGTVPQPLSFTAYGEGLKDKAPSSILRVAQSGLIETLFQDPGDALSAATVGVRLNDKILIGSRAADRFLMCDTNE
ncbi:MAG: SMP-30/gluconolactonase/LRE family protein [Pseudomonadota bacterium]